MHDFLGVRHLAGELRIVSSQSVPAAWSLGQIKDVALLDPEAGHRLLGEDYPG